MLHALEGETRDCASCALERQTRDCAFMRFEAAGCARYQKKELPPPNQETARSCALEAAGCARYQKKELPPPNQETARSCALEAAGCARYQKKELPPPNKRRVMRFGAPNQETARSCALGCWLCQVSKERAAATTAKQETVFGACQVNKRLVSKERAATRKQSKERATAKQETARSCAFEGLLTKGADQRS